MIPTGKGLFVRFLRDDQVDHVINRCRAAGVEWVAVLVLWQYTAKPSRHGGDLTNAARRLAAAGLRVVPWAYSVPGRTAEIVRVLSVEATRCGSAAVIVDAEREWRGRASAPLVASINALKAGGRSVGLTSYGAPWNHRSFPWEAVRAADFSIPQIYEMAPMPASYPARSVEAYRQHGARVVIPATSGMTSRRHMRSLLERTPAPRGLIWWDLLNLDTQPQRWDVVREYADGGAS